MKVLWILLLMFIPLNVFGVDIHIIFGEPVDIGDVVVENSNKVFKSAKVTSFEKDGNNISLTLRSKSGQVSVRLFSLKGFDKILDKILDKICKKDEYHAVFTMGIYEHARAFTAPWPDLSADTG